LPDDVRAACFDIGGTLVHTPRGSLADEISRLLDADVSTVRGCLVEHGKRQPTTPALLAGHVAAACGRPESARVVEEVLGQRGDDISQPLLYEDARSVLDALRLGGGRIFYLSNAVGYLSAPTPHYYEYADGVVHSWQIGSCKPELRAFMAIETLAGLPPEGLVQVGDSWRADIEGALAAGWSAVHLVRGAATCMHCNRDVPHISNLNQLLGILPPVMTGQVARRRLEKGGAPNDLSGGA
jgi:putative hydrolase of the HAD superfamily